VATGVLPLATGVLPLATGVLPLATGVLPRLRELLLGELSHEVGCDSEINHGPLL
jgi:hypothetical protein